MVRRLTNGMIGSLVAWSRRSAMQLRRSTLSSTLSIAFSKVPSDGGGHEVLTFDLPALLHNASVRI